MHVMLVRVQPADTGEPIKDWWQGQQLQQGSLRAGSWQSRIREECRNTQKRRGLHRRRSTGLVGLATQIKLTTGAAAWGAAPEGGAASRPRLSSPACSCSRGKHALGCAAAIGCCIARQGRCSSSHAPPTLRAALPFRPTAAQHPLHHAAFQLGRCTEPQCSACNEPRSPCHLGEEQERGSPARLNILLVPPRGCNENRERQPSMASHALHKCLHQATTASGIECGPLAPPQVPCSRRVWVSIPAADNIQQPDATHPRKLHPHLTAAARSWWAAASGGWVAAAEWNRPRCRQWRHTCGACQTLVCMAVWTLNTGGQTHTRRPCSLWQLF